MSFPTTPSSPKAATRLKRAVPAWGMGVLIIKWGPGINNRVEQFLPGGQGPVHHRFPLEVEEIEGDVEDGSGPPCFLDAGSGGGMHAAL